MTYSITLTKRFGEHVIFQDKHVEIQQGAVTTIVGPSGCGKTTLLRMLMGFEDPDDSDIASLSGLGFPQSSRKTVCARTSPPFPTSVWSVRTRQRFSPPWMPSV
jgi:ABC-type nitrate/sulfonate/bicarbonate transport system ATPase subunit